MLPRAFLLLFVLEASIALGWHGNIPSPWHAGALAFYLVLYLGLAALARAAAGAWDAPRAPDGRDAAPARPAVGLALAPPAVLLALRLPERVPARFALAVLLPAAVALLASLVAPRLHPPRRVLSGVLRRYDVAVPVFFVATAVVLLNQLDPSGFFARCSLVMDAWILSGGLALSLLLWAMGRRAARAGGRARGADPDSLPATAIALAALVAFAAARGARHGHDAFPGGSPPAAVSLAARQGVPRPNVLFLVVDTLRGDVVDDPLAREPDLAGGFARLERDGTRFLRATSPSSWTVPSVSSMLAGVHPRRIDAFVRGIDAAPASLPVLLREAGYRTAAFVDNYVVSGPGFERGFDRFECDVDIRRARVHTIHRLLPFSVQERLLRAFRQCDRGAAFVVGSCLRWIGGEEERPFFAYVHLMDPHYPYYGDESALAILASGVSLSKDRYSWCFDDEDRGGGPPRYPRSAFREMRARYLREVRRVDAALGTLARGLDERGLWDGTLVIVVGDHGEEFGEHGGFGHGQSVYEELVNVPLYVKWPRAVAVPPRAVETPVGAVDLYATCLEAVGIAAREGAAGGLPVTDGASLLPLARGNADRPRPILAETMASGAFGGAIWKYRVGDREVIVRQGPGGPAEVESVTIASARGEEAPVPRGTWSTEDSALVEEAFAYYSRIWRDASGEPAAGPSELVERLRALGYVR